MKSDLLMSKWFHILEDTAVKFSLDANQLDLVINYALLQVICIFLYHTADLYNNLVGLGADVVMRLLSNVEHSMRLEVYFDNFFTYYHLLCLLSEKVFVLQDRSNRIGGAYAELKTG